MHNLLAEFLEQYPQINGNAPVSFDVYCSMVNFFHGRYPPDSSSFVIITSKWQFRIRVKRGPCFGDLSDGQNSFTSIGSTSHERYYFGSKLWNSSYNRFQFQNPKLKQRFTLQLWSCWSFSTYLMWTPNELFPFKKYLGYLRAQTPKLTHQSSICQAHRAFQLELTNQS